MTDSPESPVREWYRLDAGQALGALDSSEGGLTEQEAFLRLAQYGPNKLAEEGQISRLQILLHQFTSPLISGSSARCR